METNSINCRYCEMMAEWEFNEDHAMNAFVCTYWEKEKKKPSNSIWVYPEMDFSCDHFSRAGADVASVRKLEEKMFILQQENEALHKELKKYE
jgi:hypothetical protein